MSIIVWFSVIIIKKGNKDKMCNILEIGGITDFSEIN